MSGKAGYTDRFGIYNWPRFWSICEETGALSSQGVGGVCTVHGGDACLIGVVPLADVERRLNNLREVK